MAYLSNNSIRFFLIMITLLFLVSLLVESATVTERCHPEEKKALLKMKKAFKNATIINRSWSLHRDCCDWYGVTCDSTNNNHVYGLTFMEGDDFSGPIPDAIGDLSYLTAINLANISTLSGSIPFSITKLQNLQILEIIRSNLTGTIPVFLSKLKNLAYLDLSYNKLTGPIPSSLSEIPGLSFIKLVANRLTGTIPESFVKLKGNDLFLILSHNKLTGEIPPSFGDINFGSVDFSHNELRGDISMMFGRNKTTASMNFARNKFEFNMSKFHKHQWLAELDISHNTIYGTLPKEMITVEWQSLNVSYNRLCGPIPQGGNLQTNFDYTSFFHNRCLCGAPLTVPCK